MRVRLRGLLLVGSLVVIAGVQGCASKSPAKAAGRDAVAAAPAVSKGKPSSNSSTSPAASVPPEPAAVAKSAPSSSPAISSTSVLPPAVQPYAEPAAQMVAPQESKSAAKPEPRPLPKPAATEEGKSAPKPLESRPVAKPAEVKPVTKFPESPITKPAEVAPASKPAELQPVATAEAAATAKPQVKPAAPITMSTPQPEPASAKSVAEAEGVKAEPQTPHEVVDIEEKEVEVTLESLPITLHGVWVLSASTDACNLSTVPVQFDDGQGMSKLQLVFTAKQWLIRTQSDIDMSYSGTGLMVDEDGFFPLEELVRGSDLAFTRQYVVMTQAFIAGKTLRITLGFWPTWPITETKTVTVSLEHFASAHRAWKRCLSLINGR
ncbi:MAG: hypothetical protein NVV73_13345 [Cellvibrionaceae bacterium]|nr:hypothetical protein [Cellvibrionaceae bacterium]